MVFKYVIFEIFVLISACFSVKIEFDEANISKLQLKISWNAKNEAPNKFVLIMEQKRFMGTEYSSPVLIDDEATIETSLMERTRFKARWPLRRKSKIDCAMNCINSSALILKNNNTFDCNIFYYEPKYKICVLYEYDFSGNNSEVNKTSKLTNFSPAIFTLPDNSIYDFFIDECEIDEILSGIHGYVRFCRKLLNYKEEHMIKINPYVDYQFSLSVRNSNNTWTAYTRREYQYAPKINIDVRGDLKLGKNISIECKTDLHPSIIDSITWKNANHDTFSNGILYIKSLNHYNIYQTYFCEIRYNQARMMQKAFKLNITAIEQNLKSTPPKLTVNLTLDEKKLKVNMSWNVKLPEDNFFKPQRIILLYNENYKEWKFVGKYLLFQISKHDNVQFISHNTSEEISVKDEEECALHCLQSNFCDHFVYRIMDPTRLSSQKNCHLTKNTHENLIDCRLDSICANLASYEDNIHNDSVSISILPNVTYKFRVQLKDEVFNWTNLEETAAINLPLKLSVNQEGSTLLTEKNKNSPFLMKCNTNVNKNLPIILSWTKNGKDIIINGTLFNQSSSKDSPYLNSILEFNSLNQFNFHEYNDVYRCKATYSNAEVGQTQGVIYFSETSKVKFSFREPLSYNVSFSNISVPTIPGLLFELSCQVSGNPRPKIKWLIDGINYSEKKFETFTDEPFVINITFMDSWHMNHILVFKMDNKRKKAKYECILNDKITIREHFIKVVDEKPQLNVQLDKSNLNELNMKIQMNVEHKNDQFLKGLDSKPLKMSIMYVENSIFSNMENSTFNPGYYETIRIAPDTLSHDTTLPAKNKDRVPIATLKNAERSMLSCKLLCFNTPFCQSYEHLVLENSCNFYSSQEIETYYNNLIEEIKNKSNSNFNLLHLLRGNILTVLDENLDWSNRMHLADTKSISTTECESRHSTAEIHCSDQLSVFTKNYVFDNLVPGSSYQFKIQVTNAFGQSQSIITEVVEVPFPLSPIAEKTSIDKNKSTVSLFCKTSLRYNRNLKFKWYRNEQLITKEDANFEQIVTDSSEVTWNNFTSELKFKVSSSQLNGYYTCSLEYTDNFWHKTISRNQSIIFRTKSGPFYTTYKDINLEKQSGSSWSESCTAEGWPLPKVEWLFNGEVISNTTDDDLINPHIINHYRHLTASSYLIINSMSQRLSGRYLCVLNGNISIKNVTIHVIGDDIPNKIDNSGSTKSKKSEKMNSDRNSQVTAGSVFMSLLLIISLAGLTTLSVYLYLLKRKRSHSDTSLLYNRIEEEVMTGVDNPNLLEDEIQS